MGRYIYYTSKYIYELSIYISYHFVGRYIYIILGSIYMSRVYIHLIILWVDIPGIYILYFEVYIYMSFERVGVPDGTSVCTVPRSRDYYFVSFSITSVTFALCTSPVPFRGSGPGSHISHPPPPILRVRAWC